MEKRWFVINNNEVSGPYSTFEVDSKFSPEQINEHTRVWWRGQSHWSLFKDWKKKLPELTQAEKQAPERLWYLQINGEKRPPMRHTEMIKTLSGIKDLSNVLIWTEGMQTPQSIYNFHKIADELGVSRRKHPRIPIEGKVTLTVNDTVFLADAHTISEGGLGILNIQGIRIGDTCKVSLESPNLYMMIRATAEVVYVSDMNYVGMSFVNIPIESLSTIVEYIRKYSNEQKAEKVAA